MISSIEKAKFLKKEADQLLYEHGIHDILQEYGKVIYVGSYALDLMAWPDIDLDIIVPKGKNATALACKLASDFIAREESIKVAFIRRLHLRRQKGIPVGLCVSARMEILTAKPNWKLDMWLIDEKQAGKTLADTKKIKAQLTEEKCAAILEWKNRLLTKDGRTPSLSGYWLYQAILSLTA